MKFFHVTLSSNTESIQKSGLDPRRSIGKLKSVWIVTESRLPWAIAHVAAKYDVSPEHLTVFGINVNRKRVKATRLRGVYTCASIIKPQKPPTNAAVIISVDRE